MKLCKTCIASLALLLSHICSADVGVVASVGSGPYYDNLCANTNSCALIRVTPHESHAGCASAAIGWSYVLDTSTVSGKNTLALLLTAQATKQPVNISGFGTCTIFNNVEDFRLVYFE